MLVHISISIYCAKFLHSNALYLLIYWQAFIFTYKQLRELNVITY